MTTTTEREFFGEDGIKPYIKRRHTFRLSDRVIRQAVRSGELRSAVFGRKRVFTSGDVDDWLERRHSEAKDQHAQAV